MRAKQIIKNILKAILTAILVVIIPPALLMTMAGEGVGNHYEWWQLILLIAFKFTMLAIVGICAHTIIYLWTGKWKLPPRLVA